MSCNEITIINEKQFHNRSVKLNALYVNFVLFRIIHDCLINIFIFRCIRQKQHSVQRMNGQNQINNKIPSLYSPSLCVCLTCYCRCCCVLHPALSACVLRSECIVAVGSARPEWSLPHVCWHQWLWLSRGSHLFVCRHLGLNGFVV